jgi:hypothetical protein
MERTILILSFTIISIMLRNPVYAQADLELYEFFKSQGAAIVNDAADFTGTNGCYLYQGRDIAESKNSNLKGHCRHERRGRFPGAYETPFMKRLSGYLDDWDNISFEDRRLVVDGLITNTQATSENIRIE